MAVGGGGTVETSSVFVGLAVWVGVNPGAGVFVRVAVCVAVFGCVAGGKVRVMVTVQGTVGLALPSNGNKSVGEASISMVISPANCSPRASSRLLCRPGRISAGGESWIATPEFSGSALPGFNPRDSNESEQPAPIKEMSSASTVSRPAIRHSDLPIQHVFRIPQVQSQTGSGATDYAAGESLAE